MDEFQVIKMFKLWILIVWAMFEAVLWSHISYYVAWQTGLAVYANKRYNLPEESFF